MGLRKIDEIADNSLHPLITPTRFIPCVLHGFARQGEKLIHLELLNIVSLKSKGVCEAIILEKQGIFFSLSFFFEKKNHNHNNINHK